MAKWFPLLAVSLLATLASPSCQSPTGSPPVPSVTLTASKTVLETGQQTILSCTVVNLVRNAPLHVAFLREASHPLFWFTTSLQKGAWTTTATKGDSFLDSESESVASQWPVYRVSVYAKTASVHNYTCTLHAEPQGKEATFTSNKLEITAK